MHFPSAIIHSPPQKDNQAHSTALRVMEDKPGYMLIAEDNRMLKKLDLQLEKSNN